MAAALGAASVAFPAISCGVYGYPPEEAAPVALAATRDALAALPQIDRVRFVLFGEDTYDAFRAALAQVTRG